MAARTVWRIPFVLLTIVLSIWTRLSSGQGLTISPVRPVLLEGETLLLNCSIFDPEDAAMLTWETDNTEISSAMLTQEDNNITTSLLMLGNVTADQAGVYVCNSSNMSISTVVTVITVPRVNDVRTSAGTTAMFFCDVSGSPDLTYGWSLSSSVTGVTLATLGSQVVGMTMPNLIITEVTYSDSLGSSALLVCTVRLNGQILASANGTLEILRATVTMNPNPTTVTVGEPATFTCTAENTPNPPRPLTFMWLRNGAPFNLDGRLTASSVNTSDSEFTSTLNITSTLRGDAGNYSCSVTNFGTNNAVFSAAAELTIRFPPVIVDVTVQVNGITIDPVGGQHQVNANTNTNTVIGRADAVPPLTDARLFRLEDGNRTLEDSCVVMSNVFNCSLPALSVEESGVQFELVAGNGLGNGTSTITLLVQDVPGPVNQSFVAGTVLDLLRVRVTWAPPTVTNNAGVTGYVLTYCPAPNGTACAEEEVRVLTNSSATSFDLQHGAPLNGSILVRVLATNRVGEGGVAGEPVEIAVATTVDATPIGVRSTVLTSTFIVVVWSLPTTAEGTGIMVSYNVTVAIGGSTSTSQTSDMSVLLADGLTEMADVMVTVTAVYNNPEGVVTAAAPAVFTVPQADQVMPLISTSIGRTQPSPTIARVTWRQPADTNFLEGYFITFTSTRLIPDSQRKKRATTDSVRQDGGTTSANINVLPHSTVTVMIDAIYAGDRRVPLQPVLTFQSREDFPTAPTITSVEADGNTRLLCTWRRPITPNGIITDYEVSFMSASMSSPESERVGSAALSYTIRSLAPNTSYTVRVAAINSAGTGDQSGPLMRSTSFGVTQPTISVAATRESAVFTARFTAFRTDGDVGLYQVILTREPITDTRTMRNIPAYSRDNRDLYVTRLGTLGSQQSTGSLAIGDGQAFTVMGTTYVNQNLSGNTDYYAFVRVFSSIDPTFFNDSALSQRFRYNPGINVGAVIGSIAAVAAVLIVVLIVLLIVAYFTMSSPRKGRSSGGGGGGILREGKKHGALEMRRTRLFSPVLNVGTPDVFTSTNQPTTLICEASGTPAPTVSWTRNGEALDKERFIQLADGSLFINDTDLQDEGTYTVAASNSVGEEVSRVKLIVTKPSPPESDPDHPPIKVGEFSEKVALLKVDEGLEDEYEEVEPDTVITSYCSKININRNKNRYINIIPYDHSRVVLSLQDSTPGSDYINASFIDAHQRPNGYIASQGPMPSTFPDFWRMIWELDTPTIVMVTNLTEDDKVKCHQYWPSYGTTTYGNIQVTLKEVENLAEYSIRTFNVSPLAGQSRVQMPVRELRQFQFLVWPDHGVPTYATNLLSFRKRVLKYHPEKRGPMVVHCSAGVGRTGTFITIDYMLKQIEAEGKIDIFNFVRQMRYRRNYMVQTASQYVFIHEALMESIMCGDNSIKAPNLKRRVKELKETVAETGMTGFETQFKTLEAASPPDEDFDCTAAQLPDNMPKNKTKAHLPANETRVVLSSDNKQSDYICASFVDNYRERNAFIVTQGPLEETANDFWRMMWETKSASIVMLTELKEEGEEMCVKYWPSSKGEPDVYGDYQVQLSEDEKDRGDYTTRRFKLSPVDSKSEGHMVSQFHFIRWSKTLPPKDCRPMIDLIEELQRVQRKSGNMPITVHCDDGIGRTGAFCTLYSVLERVKTEQIVDVFQAVKTLRIQRTGLLATVSEYEFVHHAVTEFLETFSEYQNFK